MKLLIVALCLWTYESNLNRAQATDGDYNKFNLKVLETTPPKREIPQGQDLSTACLDDKMASLKIAGTKSKLKGSSRRKRLHRVWRQEEESSNNFKAWNSDNPEAEDNDTPEVAEIIGDSYCTIDKKKSHIREKAKETSEIKQTDEKYSPSLIDINTALQEDSIPLPKKPSSIRSLLPDLLFKGVPAVRPSKEPSRSLERKKSIRQNDINVELTVHNPIHATRQSECHDWDIDNQREDLETEDIEEWEEPSRDH